MSKWQGHLLSCSGQLKTILLTWDISDIWSEWWGDMTWQKNTYLPTYLPTYLSTYLCTSIREHPLAKGAIIETCHLWDIWSAWWGDMTWPKNSTYPPTYLSTYLRAHPQDAILETCDLYDICSEWWGDLTWPKKALRCCDIWDTDYNTDNWEPEFMTIFVNRQLIVTLDSIRNSCDVFCMIRLFWKECLLEPSGLFTGFLASLFVEYAGT